MTFFFAKVLISPPLYCPETSITFLGVVSIAFSDIMMTFPPVSEMPFANIDPSSFMLSLEITLILNNSGKLNKPVISYRGIPQNSFDEKIIFEMEDEIFNTCRTFSLKNKNQEKNLIEMIKQNCRRIVKDKTGKKPFTNINLVKI